MSAIYGAGCRLPQGYVAHEGRCRRKVPGNGCEIKWCNSEYEPFQRTVFQSVPHSIGRIGGLLAIEFLSVPAIEIQKVDHFTGCINFCLECIFALTQNRGCIQGLITMALDDGCHFLKNCSTGFPSHLRPSLPRIHGRFDGHFYFFWSRHMIMT